MNLPIHNNLIFLYKLTKAGIFILAYEVEIFKTQVLNILGG